MATTPCGAPTRAGPPCSVAAGLCREPGCGRCLVHDPHRAELLRRGRRKGQLRGAHRRRLAPKVALQEELPGGGKLEDLDDALRLLSWIAVAVATGQLDVAVAKEATSACANFVRGDKLRAYDRELRSLQRELAALKQQQRD